MTRLLLFFRFFLLSGGLLLPAFSLADVTPPVGQVAPPTPTPAPLAPAPAPSAPAPEPAEAIAAPAATNTVLPDKTGLLPAASPSNPDEAFTRALKAYNAGALEDARREFLAIVEAGHISAPLAHNLGNIEFRRGNHGQAVLWYKRALAIQPFSPETLQNLRTIDRQTAFVTFDRFGLSASHLSPSQVRIITMAVAWAFILLFVWLVWLTPRRGHRWPLVVLLIVLVPVLGTGVGLAWYIEKDETPLAKRQIVSGKETDAFAAPAEASSRVMTLPAGSEVVPIETRGNWLYCIIPGGAEDQPLRGWIRSAKLEPLWPYAAGI